MIVGLADQKLLVEFGGQKSLQRACECLMERMRIEVKMRGDFPGKGPVVLVADYPGGVGALAVMSVLDRADVYLVGQANYEMLGKQMKKQLLPIYRKKMWRDRLWGMFIDSYQVHVLDSREEVMRLNRLTIKRAARLVDQGNVVMIFPTGSGGNKAQRGKWKPGVGFLVQQVKNPATRVVLGHIGGVHKRDFVRYIRPGIRNLLFCRKNLTISFSKPVELGTLMDKNIHGREMAYKLEQKQREVFGLD